jgi:hypothetical protein
VPELPREPVAPGARLRDPEEGGGLRWPLTAALRAVTRACPDGAPSGARGTRRWGARRHRQGSLVAIQADQACARLRQGGPPR